MELLKPVIFISYAHADEPEKHADGQVRWLSFVRTFLQPLVKDRIVDLWADRHMTGGAKWEQEIEDKLRACDIFILLVSAHSMASDYIVDKEIAIIRERQANGDDVHFYPLLLRPTPKVALDKVRDFNLRPRDAQPFSAYSVNEREQHMTEAANEIAEIAERIAKQKGASQRMAAQSAAQPSPSSARVPFVHTTGLPETAYERLVGRDAELKRLDEAWADRNTNILSLVAEGGAGKSALVNEWLKRMQADSYRDADAVLGWSFYSQGSKERATSAEPFLNWALNRLGIEINTTSATAKAEVIAEALAQRRVLLVLDGCEPLQHGLGTQQGELKDLGLRALLRRFVYRPPAEGHGLVVLTSRLTVKDIARWRDSAAPVLDMEQLSDEAGAALLRDNGVWGANAELRAAARAFGGHPLALGLLASFLKETQFGDVRRRDHVHASPLFADPENPRHDHARRVMESIESELFSIAPNQKPLHGLRVFSARGLRILKIRSNSQSCTWSGCSTGRQAAIALLHYAGSRRSWGSPTRSSILMKENGGGRSCACARCGCWRRRTHQRVTRSTPTRWCASGSVSGWNTRARRLGAPPTAGSTNTCVIRPRRATPQRSKTSRRSTRPSPTAAAPGATRRHWITFMNVASLGGERTASSKPIQPMC
jgi:hypothetical protein